MPQFPHLWNRYSSDRTPLYVNIYPSVQPNILNWLLFISSLFYNGELRSLSSDRDLLVDQNLLIFSCGANGKDNRWLSVSREVKHLLFFGDVGQTFSGREADIITLYETTSWLSCVCLLELGHSISLSFFLIRELYNHTGTSWTWHWSILLTIKNNNTQI